jgi:hypothetical protein
VDRVRQCGDPQALEAKDHACGNVCKGCLVCIVDGPIGPIAVEGSLALYALYGS